MTEVRGGELLNLVALMEILGVSGEDGIRSYLLGVAEGEEDAEEEEA